MEDSGVLHENGPSEVEDTVGTEFFNLAESNHILSIIPWPTLPVKPRMLSTVV